MAVLWLPIGASGQQDFDGDTIPDTSDNCPFTANTTQVDADGDLAGNVCDNCRQKANNPDAGGKKLHDTDQEGYGNACDADYDQTGLVTIGDFNTFNLSYDKVRGEPGFNEKADFDSDDFVGPLDFAFFQGRFAKAPGPSDLSCAGTAPCLPPEILTITLGSPSDGATTANATITVTGSLNKTGGSVTVNTVPATVTGSSFSAQGIALSDGSNLVTIAASTAFESATKALTVVKVGSPPPPPPPDPASVAPPAPPENGTISTSVQESTAFLYTGANPIQTDVTSGTIELERASILRGHVRMRNGAPLESVGIRIAGHEEFGKTLTRTDGMFDLAVNGGGFLTVVYERDGYIPVNRQVDAAWNEFRWLPDVVMIPRDTTSTTISNTGSMQVAQSSLVTDSDGSRRATLLFKSAAGTMVKSSGNEILPTHYKVRATEFTVGEAGPETMPAELPPTSGYTYALELSVDEAVAQGASRVNFNSPGVVLYVDNFLDMNVGVAVPLGFYSYEKAGWEADESGRVIKIVSEETSGRANLDVTGDNTADTGTALTDLGIDDAERDSLGDLFDPGQELSRFRIDHFSIPDGNYPRVTVTAPSGAKAPSFGGFAQRNQNQTDCNKSCGSIIEIENQSIGEVVPIVGTPYRLHYQSERVTGRRAGAFGLDIPLSDSTLPGSVTDIELEVQVAGQRLRRSFAPAPDLSYVYAWDGKDAYGRNVQGRQTAIVKIGYRYDASYQGASRFFATNFGGSSPGAQLSRNGILLVREMRMPIGGFDASQQGLGGWTLDVHHSYDPTGRQLYLGDGTRRTIDLLPRVVRKLARGNQPWGSIGTQNTGDGGLAVNALFSNLSSLAVDPDGSVYVTANIAGSSGGLAGQRIRRIRTDGIIDSVAGDTGNACSVGEEEGGPAISACMLNPLGLSIAADGSLLIAQGAAGGPEFVQKISAPSPGGIASGILSRFIGGGDFGSPQLAEGMLRTTQMLFRIVKGIIGTAPDGTFYFHASPSDTDPAVRIISVTPDDKVYFFAGGGSGGDGGAALQATIGDARAMDAGPDGSVYFSDNNVVRRVFPDGRIDRVAGGGTPADGIGDGGPATSAALPGQVQRIAVAPDGGLYIAHGTAVVAPNGSRVRYVAPDGNITTVIGTGDSSAIVRFGAINTGAVASNNSIGLVTGMDVGPDGSLYLATTRPLPLTGTAANRESFVLRISSPFPGLGPNENLVLSSDGSEIYQFSAKGRHLQTLDALTGDPKLTFTHDGNGYLTSIQDVDSTTVNVTTIQRNSATPTAIVAPLGQTTSLDTSTDGFLSGIQNPAGEAHQMTYYPGGLLATFQRPNSEQSVYGYDGRGLLASAQDAEGGLLTLEPEFLNGVSTVYTSTSEGVNQSYSIERLSSGLLKRKVTDAAGLVTERVIDDRTRFSTTTTTPNGMQRLEILGLDPRFGMAGALPARIEVSTPSMLADPAADSKAFRVVRRRAATFQTANDPASGLATQIDTYTIGEGFSDANPDIRPQFVELYTETAGTVTLTTEHGRAVERTLDAFGRTASLELSGIPAVQQIDYDARGRVEFLTSDTPTLDRITQFGYHSSTGFLQTITDAAGRTTQFTTDSAGRVTLQTLPDGRTIGFGYDANGNLTSLTPPGRPAHGFAHNGVDREILYSPPTVPGVSQPSTSFAYDLDKRLDLITRPGNSTIDLGYVSNRLAAVTTAAGTTSLSYFPSTHSWKGNLDSVSAPGGQTLSFGYDGSLVSSAAWSGPVSGSVGFGYYSAPRNASVAPITGGFPLQQATETVNGAPVSFDYDYDGLLIEAGDLLIERDPGHGLAIGTTLGSVASDLVYDSFGDLVGEDFGANRYQLALVRDSTLGRVTRKIETLQNATTTTDYSYEPLTGRLDTVTVGGTLVRDYAYDLNSNRIKVTSGGPDIATYDNQDRLLTYNLPAPTTYTYTPAGDLDTKTASGGTTDYDYDALGNLRHVSLPSGTQVDYVIDGFNHRVGKKVNNSLVQGFLYRNNLQIVAELNGSNQVLSRFVYGSKPNVPDTMLRGGQTYRIISDHLGSVRLVVSSGGTVVQQIDYDEFGNVTQDTSPGFQPFGFAGGLYDRDTGLVRFGARDYDPAVGRWTSKDSIRFAGGDLNLYGYVLTDPVNFFDPSGHVGLGTAIVSAIAGGAINAAIASANGDDVGNAAFAGAVGGFVGGFIGSPGAAGAVAAATSSLIASAQCENSTLGGALTNAAISGAAGYFGGSVGGALGAAGVPSAPAFGESVGASAGGIAAGGAESAARSFVQLFDAI